MAEDIKLGSLFTWTVQTPKESGKIVDEFYAFIDDQLDQLEENACRISSYQRRYRKRNRGACRKITYWKHGG